MDVKIDTFLNSGLQCRSRVLEKDTTTMDKASIATNGATRQIKSKRRAREMWEYQLELDPSRRVWSGGLYEQGISWNDCDSGRQRSSLF